ncbi:MAG: FGGY-family carbohydrate kinase [Lachnospiraceae bacterium]|nr:FGGY-family carbohydrate kinase [Lachnospiraceae bacterium]
MQNIKDVIQNNQTALGIEFGSTRIKAVLTDLKGNVLAGGAHDWENSLVNGVWTYSYDEIENGLKSCYSALKKDVKDKYGVVLTSVGAMGVSAMMHGYIALDFAGKPLAPFRTWRNSETGEAAEELTNLFGFNIPLRWTVSHLYQRMLDKEPHLAYADFVTTLDSYIHYRLTGEKVTGVGDASGIFPIDPGTLNYDAEMAGKFETLAAKHGYDIHVDEIFPKVLVAGDVAGKLTEEGARLIDPEGDLKAGIPLCPPEGDAGTGMVATNAVKPGTGNVSAGTSTFAMVVLEKNLSKLHREIDMVTTPTGFPVAMSHANNGTSDLNAWVGMFKEFAELLGCDISMGELYEKLYRNSLSGDADCGGLMSYGYYSGEGITKLSEGRPLYMRTPESRFNLANLMRSHLYASLGAVKLGMDILTKDEGVTIKKITGHGGLFKTEGVAQKYLAAAVNSPVTVMETAGEGGPWGMAVLAAYMNCRGEGESLEDFLEKIIFADAKELTMDPDPADVAGFEQFTERYKAGIAVEAKAVESVKW